MVSRIRSVIKTTGVIFALVVGVCVPFGYFLDDFLEARERVELEAARSAASLAKYAYSTGPLWHYTPLRLQEILAHRSLREKYETRQSVLSLDGEVIYAESNVLASPVHAGRAPIQLGHETIGWIEAEESLRPLVEETGVIALIFVILGLAAFFLFRVLPLRVLDRTLARLQARETELTDQHLISESALNNMSQGLCMFDTEKRLVICNRRFTDMYNLPKELTIRGTLLADILEHRIGSGSYSESPERYINERLTVVASSEQQIDIVEQKDGRTIEILYDPLPGGGWVATHEDITARRHAEVRIAYLASHDSLTDLPNRVLFREKLEAALVGVASGDSLAVLSLDLDRFKEVNDTLGHPAGDALLQEVARRLRSTLREDDVVARLGGDEFALVQSHLHRPEAASDLAVRLIQELGEPYLINGHQLNIGASVGVTIAPTDGVDPDHLLRNADMALYRAKSEGRSAFRFFEREMDNRLQARRVLETELRAALRSNEFEVYYQPVFNIEANAICGFEALLRWHHPTRGMVPPGAFIPLAEETGLIVEIGAWVLRQACSEASKWPSLINVAVNLSPLQFKNGKLLGTVEKSLAATGLAPGRLELEVTETVLLQESDATLDTLHKLRALGVRIVMDDFGTGYSSLSYLRSFPFDKIKIDRSFISELSTKKDSSAIVHAIIGLARDLGMTTTAEGVENQEDLDLLRADGCTEIQGYLISPGKPATYVPELLARYDGKQAKIVHHLDAVKLPQRIRA